MAVAGSPTEWPDNSAICCTTSNVTWNGTGARLDYYTIRQPGNEVRLDPQQSAGTVLRFTAPTTALYSAAGLWDAIDIFQNGVNWSIFPMNPDQ